MTTARQELLRRMTDHEFHSGESLGNALSVSRAAVWKQIQALQEEGIEFEIQHGKGYRLITEIDFLDEQTILKQIPKQLKDKFDFTLMPEVESTSSYLLTQALNRPQRTQVCVAERQTAGRGRRGREWQSAYGTSLTMSLLWRADNGVAALAGLSLATGVAIAQSLENLGGYNLQLKWPNDLVYRDAKVGGILIEVSGDAVGPCYVVIGIGLNVCATIRQSSMQKIEQPWCNLRELDPDTLLSRNSLCASIIESLLNMLQRFNREGFPVFREAFLKRDALYRREVKVLRGERETLGRAMGVADDGSLLLDTSGQTLTINSGEVSVRALG